MEGPSVHRIADALHTFTGQTIERVAGNTRQPKELLKGERIASIRAVKKRLFIETGIATAVIHFLMYGSYRVNERRDLDERLSLHCSTDDLHLYSCSAKVLHNDSEELAGYDNPAGDVLSPLFDRERATHAIRSDGRIIADVLLDQDIFGGIGNILKNEVLFQTKVHPASVASALPNDTAAVLVDTAIELATAWYHSKQQDKRTAWNVYQKSVCPACTGRLTRKKMGSFDRVTFFCPECQRPYPSG